MGSHVPTGWANTSLSVAFRSGEGELYASLKVAVEMSGAIQRRKDLRGMALSLIWDGCSCGNMRYEWKHVWETAVHTHCAFAGATCGGRTEVAIQQAHGQTSDLLIWTRGT